MKLPDRAILILEGIHGLNDALTPLVERQRKHKIYVSALTQLNLDDHNRIATTDNRLIRRMVRDSRFRGHSGLKTLAMWPSVRRGRRQEHLSLPEYGGLGIQFRPGLRAGRPESVRGASPRLGEA